jgi:ATP-dependent Clp protease protease subunit
VPSALDISPSDDLEKRLLNSRIIFLGREITDEVANGVCSQLLLLDADPSGRDVTLYINSPGGSVDAGFAIYDTMQYVECDVATVCVGLAASMGQFLLVAGTPGKRYALPHSRILMHQPHGQLQGQATDIAIHAEQFAVMRRLMAERIAEHTGQPVERIIEDFDRDRWFNAAQALGYGMIDQVLDRRRPKVAALR